MKNFKVRLKNKDGEKIWMYSEANNATEAQHEALRRANSGHARGIGWVVLFCKEDN